MFTNAFRITNIEDYGQNVCRTGGLPFVPSNERMGPYTKSNIL